MRRLRLGCLGLVAGVVVCCRGPVERTLTDTEGRRFVTQCSANGVCSLRVADATGPSRGKDQGNARMEFRTTGRVVGLCGPLLPGASPTASDCRPLVCSDGSECPSAQGMTEGVCLDGLCSEPSSALNSDDAVMLCLAGTGVGPRSPLQIERLALGLNCGSPCVVPTPCRQP